MLNSRHLNKIVVVLICLSLLVCAVMVYLAQVNPKIEVAPYESKLFGEEILSLEIQVDEEDWQGLLDDPTAKEYIAADLTINGETFSSVGLRTKGNSSLTQVAQMNDSDRYSLQFKFNQFQKGQTCYGLDSFCINNLMGDNTCMKDYLSYDIMNYIGVPAPLMNYARVTVNGEDFGFYLALERYEKAFLDRVYNSSGGQLYNVKIAMGQREAFMDGDDGAKNNTFPGPMNDPGEMPDAFPDGDFNQNEMEQNGPGMPGRDFEPPGKWEEAPQDNSRLNPPDQNRPAQEGQNKGAGELPKGMGGRAPGGMGGGDLLYVDESISSYSSIFDNAEFKKNSDQDKQRVIKAIKNLNEGTNLEQYFDVDEILRYLAAHTVVVNLDSYSSSMAQNYYIYEHDGTISILPWDYNLSFGGFQGGGASDTINFPIDTPVSGVGMEDRPLINKLLEVDSYREKYHEYLNQIVDGYFKSGIFEETITTLDAKINDYVKSDPTSFSTYEEYTASLPVLKELGALRAQSIEGQLNGAIPSTAEGQSANKDSLISGDGINLSALGTFMNGGGNRNAGGPDRADNKGREIPDASIDPNIQGSQGEQDGWDKFGNPEGMPGLPGTIPEGDPEEWGRHDRFPGQNVPGREGEKTAQSSTSAGNNGGRAQIILTGILLLITVAATYLLSRFRRRY